MVEAALMRGKNSLKGESRTQQGGTPQGKWSAKVKKERSSMRKQGGLLVVATEILTASVVCREFESQTQNLCGMNIEQFGFTF